MADTTRGGWTPTGTAAERRAQVDAAAGPKATRTRQRLLDAARVVAARDGYQEATVDAIVAEAGVARGTFYTYFESKTDVMRALAALIDEGVERDVVAFPRRRPGDPVDTLLQANRNYLAVVSANADLYRLVEQMAEHDEVVRKARLRSRQRHVARVAASIRRWQARGWADTDLDVPTTAAALVSMLSGFAQWQFVGGDEYDLDVAAATLTDIWVKACGLQVAPEETN